MGALGHAVRGARGPAAERLHVLVLPVALQRARDLRLLRLARLGVEHGRAPRGLALAAERLHRPAVVRLLGVLLQHHAYMVVPMARRLLLGGVLRAPAAALERAEPLPRAEADDPHVSGGCVGHACERWVWTTMASAAVAEK